MAGAVREAQNVACPSTRLDFTFCIGISPIGKEVRCHLKLRDVDEQLELMRTLGKFMDAAHCRQKDRQMVNLVSKWLEVKSSSALIRSGPDRALPPLHSSGMPGAACSQGDLSVSEESQRTRANMKTVMFRPFEVELKASEPSASSSSLCQAHQRISSRVSCGSDIPCSSSAESLMTTQEELEEAFIFSTVGSGDDLSSLESKSESDDTEGSQVQQHSQTERKDASSVLMSIMEYARVVAPPTGKEQPRFRGRRLIRRDSARSQAVGGLSPSSAEVNDADDKTDEPASPQVKQGSSNQMTKNEETLHLFRPFEGALKQRIRVAP
eukprot:TRINITY_DN18704_c0_g1_i2.p1 TRINITY_DN18704_c0_g1~~TRINITY_DN18704_c0_g1_i2.p1  ORF type:complete len:338 (+),score=51.86 TRINITY_DN18704_c0_g1_i2:45-1016(+)